MNEDKRPLEDDTVKFYKCPLCGVEKPNNKDHRGVLRPEHLRMLLTGDPAVKSQIESVLSSNSCVRICLSCQKHAGKALTVAQSDHPFIPGFRDTSSKGRRPTEFSTVFRIKYHDNPVCLKYDAHGTIVSSDVK